MRIIPVLLFAASAATALPLRSQSPSAVAAGSVVGTVHDSLAGGALEGATVQLVAADGTRELIRSASTDAEGRFTMRDVPSGRYTLGFLHPVLDSLGVEPPLKEVVVAGGAQVRVALAVPSPARLRMAVCGGNGSATQGLVMGVVRGARDHAPARGAVIDGVWLEFDLRTDEISRRLIRVADTTAANGWFALCGVPRGGTMSLRAARGADSTPFIDVEVPASGFLRRDLYLGSARSFVVATESIENSAGADRGRADTTAGRTQIRSGDGRLSGRVVTASGRRAIAGARVGIVGGAQAQADADGTWSLAGLPTGTRILEVRAVGYYPQRIPVDVVSGAADVEVALSTFRTMLDTVRITASRFRLAATGFDQRRKSGMGRYITSDDTRLRNVIFTSDVFHNVPGMRLDRVGVFGDKVLTMRGPFGRCTPATYVDGVYLPLGADDLDSFVHPDDIAGIEVYTTMVPPEFQPGMTGCGSLVIWTKPSSNPARLWPVTRRILHGIGAIAIGVGTGILLKRM